MADGYVQVPPDNSGKKIDTSELTRSDGSVVERQRVVLSDDDVVQNVAVVDPEGSLRVSLSQRSPLWFSDDYGQDIALEFASEMSYV